MPAIRLTGVGVAISDPGLIDGSRWVDAALDAMKSRSVAELHEAFRGWTDRVNNYAVADVDGNFGYIHAGKIPVRGEANGWRAVPGWTGEYEWDGYIPHDELPKAINPEVGYAVTCNQRVAGHDYPYYVGICFTPEHRARRVQAGILGLEAGVGGGGATWLAFTRIESLNRRRYLHKGIDMRSSRLRGGIGVCARTSMRGMGLQHGPRRCPTAHLRQDKSARSFAGSWRRLLGDFASEVLSEAAGSGTVLRQIVEQMTLGLDRE